MEDKKFIEGLFVKNGVELLDGPCWGMSLKAAASMRFRWNETNENRISFLTQIAESKKICQAELIHSHIVFNLVTGEEIVNKKGDGLITDNKNLMPVVTVADCMPIFIYDSVKKVFGILHSGWKGTGILKDAILLAEEKYGSCPEDFSIVMGPHIHDCCYKVDFERARYFRDNFTKDCIRQEGDKYALSLAKANFFVAEKMGVKKENIVISSECTCCNKKFGSFRRETAIYSPDVPLEERKFTVQSAWVKWQ